MDFVEGRRAKGIVALPFFFNHYKQFDMKEYDNIIKPIVHKLWINHCFYLHSHKVLIVGSI